MRWPIVLLALILHLSSGLIVTKPSLHYSDVLKVRCESLPCRSVYFGRNCYFVIDADIDISSAAKNCSTMLTGAQLAKSAPEEVWSSLMVEKSVIMRDVGVKGKTKAMCFLENVFTSSNGTNTSNAPKRSIRKGEKLVARWNMPVLAKFTDPLEVGQTIIVKGVFGPNEQRISINLMLNLLEKIALHFVIDFDRGHYAMDTSQQYKQFDITWYHYETKPLPFWRGGPFDIRFRVQEDHFQVYINGQEWDTYKFRIPLSTINHFWMYGTGYVTFLQLGEKYDPVPNSITFKNTTEVATSMEEIENRATMPFAWKFPEPLEIGQTIIIKGVFHAYEGRPYFNLQLNDQVSVAFHFVVDFALGGASIMDTARKGVWEHVWWQRGRKTSGFKRGGEFDIRFRVNKDHFMVYLNEKEFWTYDHRLPITDINHIFFYGISNVTFLQLGEKYKPIQLNPPEHTFGELPVCGKDTCSAKREIDVKNNLPTDCKTIFITGYFMSFAWKTYGEKVAPTRFYIDVKRKNGEVAMRMEPRFDKNVVAFNSYKNGAWLTEEIVNKLPFIREKKFQIAITNEAYGFQIFVDGKYLATYKHRTCPFDIARIEAGPYVYDLGIQL